MMIVGHGCGTEVCNVFRDASAFNQPEKPQPHHRCKGVVFMFGKVNKFQRDPDCRIGVGMLPINQVLAAASGRLYAARRGFCSNAIRWRRNQANSSGNYLMRPNGCWRRERARPLSSITLNKVDIAVTSFAQQIHGQVMRVMSAHGSNAADALLNSAPCRDHKCAIVERTVAPTLLRFWHDT